MSKLVNSFNHKLSTQAAKSSLTKVFLIESRAVILFSEVVLVFFNAFSCEKRENETSNTNGYIKFFIIITEAFKGLNFKRLNNHFYKLTRF